MDKGKVIQPGISRLPTGELLVRVRVKDPRTGKRPDVARKLSPDDPKRPPGKSLLEWAREVHVLLSTESVRTAPVVSKVRFKDFREELNQNRMDRGLILSPATKHKLDDTTKHLELWANVYLDAITRDDVEKWLGELGRLVKAKKYMPSYVNTWWAEFKKVMSFAALKFNIADPTAKLEAIPLSMRRTYTIEEPNSLLPEELPDFFEAAWNHARPHFALIVLGTMTGRRTCELSPIRRQGASSDIDWRTGTLQIRRSFTYDEPMEMTKTKKDVLLYTKGSSLYEVLQAHVANLRGVRAGSDLMFPPLRPGWKNASGLMARSALATPFTTICEKAKIKKRITPRAMRRTYQDLCRAAGVSLLVQQSMSGHATEEMVAHYSTVAETEGRQALIRMSDIAGLKQAARLT